ncbi:MAG: YgiQ family radical SAM protein [Ruminococcaceae bacterium]|nr:YgiQ family radical SAM protein [Oscillospiraceae bacterium]
MPMFLPVNRKDMESRGWDQPDFVLVTGDAYVDHPSFGIAIIARILEAEGFRVCILAQPAWKDESEFRRFGRPRLGFMITGGNIDSMVAHYTAARRKRSDDYYSPGGKGGYRPDRATIVYSRLARKAYPDAPIIIGGLEASLRRFAHYDYWSDSVRPSILIESGADILSYGMGEYQTIELARRLDAGEQVGEILDVRGTCVTIPVSEYKPRPVAECASYERVCESKKEYAVACRIQNDEHDPIRGKTIIQRHGDRMLICNPPMPPVTTEEFDRVYELPYERRPHPMYDSVGGVPSIEEVEFSVIHNRGCFGACAFCSLAFHQGRMISTRSRESVIREVESFTKNPRFKGNVHDVGGPTANFRLHSCKKQDEAGMCKGKRCLAPKPCPALQVDHSEYLELLRDLRKIKGVKRVFVRSGIRFDYLMLDEDDSFMRELIKYHVSGQLKVAPEHCSNNVLDAMGKPHIEVYREFSKKFFRITAEEGKEQYLVPYLMSSHPGSTLRDAVELALFLKEQKLRPEQVQDFYPTPGTIATCMFYTGLDPYTLKEVYVPRTPEEKAEQRVLLQYFKKENQMAVERALRKAGRADLIGTGKNCLIKPSPATLIKQAQSGRNGAKKNARPGANRSGGRKPGGNSQRRKHK